MKKTLCDQCINCLIRQYKKKEQIITIKTCLIDKLHVYNDLVSHAEEPNDCNKMEVRPSRR